MIPMATSSPAPTLQPSDVNVVYISIFVSAAAVLCGCLMCGIVCCGCGLWWIWKKCHQTPVDPRSPNPRSPNHRAQNYGSVDERTPLVQDVDEAEGAGAGGDGDGVPRHLSFSTAGVGQYSNNDRRQSAVGGVTEKERSTNRAAEAQLKRLCLIQSGVRLLTISTTQRELCLGNGDATLIVDEGTVEMDTVVRYAVILHGPFVYSAGYKPASVVVYLNLEGANLLKPPKLMLKLWCKPVEVSGEAVLKPLRAPHTTGEMENFRYIFHEVQGDFLRNTATFTISEPQYLYCVEMKVESQASYNAIPFQMSLPEDDLVKFRIQLVYDSREWNARLMETLEKEGWKNTNKGDPVPKFFFCDKQITAAPHESHGRGWQANIHGHQSVRESDFLEILGKAHPVVLADIKDGRYPPCIYYKVLYTSAAERRRVPGLLKAELHGADVNLFFTCKVFEEQVPPDEASLTTGEHVATASLESHGRRKAHHCSDSSRHMSTWNDAALVSLKDKLKLNLSMTSGLSDKLEKAAGGFCSRYEAQEIRGLSNNHEQIGRVIETLRGKANEDFHTFCTMLRETNNDVWADELEKKAVWHEQQGGEDIECPSDPPAKKARL